MNQVQQGPSTPQEQLRAIRIFFAAIIIGAILFSLVVLGVCMISKRESPFIGIENIILGIVLLTGLVCFIVANRLYNKGIAIAKDSLISLPDKLNQYRESLIKYMALCEGPALFGIILFFLTGNYLMFITTGAMIAAMLMKMPTRNRVVEELALDWQQQEQLS